MESWVANSVEYGAKPFNSYLGSRINKLRHDLVRRAPLNNIVSRENRIFENHQDECTDASKSELRDY